MQELTETETSQVGGGLGPLAIIAIDLALTGVFFGALSVHYAGGGYNLEIGNKPR